MRYFRRNPFAQIRLASIDLLCQLSSWIKPPLPLPQRVRRILLANPAHLGDAVITTALIRALKSHDSQIQIDVLCGSWSKPIFASHPGVANVYELDLPALNRANISRSEKRAIYDKGYKKLQSLLSGVHYDLVASVYAYEPSYIPTLNKLIQAPMVGFSSAGYSPLLTRSFNTMNQEWHEVQHQAKILECILGEPLSQEGYKLWLPTSSNFSDGGQPYVVIHPGSGDIQKEWDVSGWSQTISFLQSQGIRVVITGSGMREELMAQAITKNLHHQNNIENLVGKLSFSEFSTYIEHATLLISVDSVAAHIAAAYSIPEIILSLGKTDMHRWGPLTNDVVVLNWQNRQKMQDINIADLKEAIESMLAGLKVNRGVPQ